MGQWDTKFLSLLRSLGIKVDLYKRYVDDTLKVCPPINKGWIFCTKTKKMIFDKKVFQNDCDEPAVRTAKTINLIANSIEKDIQLTFDLPDFHEDRKMSVLDLKVWCSKYVILYTFYKKEIASKFTILKRSALSETIKRNTCFMEAIRRILNISSNLPWSETVKHLNEYSYCMMISGYSKFERYHTISGAIKRCKMKCDVKNGSRQYSFRDR